MIRAITLILVLQLIGEALSEAFSLVLPGPVIGMVLLLLILIIRGRWVKRRADGHEGKDDVPAPLSAVSEGLLSNLSLLFVPAGVGVILHLDLLREVWLPILIALIVSTAAGVVVTALIADRLNRLQTEGAERDE